jgi:hypothetical protein
VQTLQSFGKGVLPDPWRSRLNKLVPVTTGTREAEHYIRGRIKGEKSSGALGVLLPRTARSSIVEGRI